MCKFNIWVSYEYIVVNIKILYQRYKKSVIWNLNFGWISLMPGIHNIIICKLYGYDYIWIWFMVVKIRILYEKRVKNVTYNLSLPKLLILVEFF